MVAWLALVMVGREHVLQAFGIHLACVHPGGAPKQSEPTARTHDSHASHGDGHHDGQDAARAAADDDGPTASDHDDDDGDDCPPGCTECACGAAPCEPSLPPVMADRLSTFRDWEALPHLAGPSRDATTLDRPPRRG